MPPAPRAVKRTQSVAVSHSIRVELGPAAALLLVPGVIYKADKGGGVEYTAQLDGLQKATAFKQSPQLHFTIEHDIPASPEAWDTRVADYEAQGWTTQDQADRVVMSFASSTLAATETIFKTVDGSLHYIQDATKQPEAEDYVPWNEYVLAAEAGIVPVPV